VTALWSCY